MQLDHAWAPLVRSRGQLDARPQFAIAVLRSTLHRLPGDCLKAVFRPWEGHGCCSSKWNAPSRPRAPRTLLVLSISTASCVVNHRCWRAGRMAFNNGHAERRGLGVADNAPTQPPPPWQTAHSTQRTGDTSRTSRGARESTEATSQVTFCCRSVAALARLRGSNAQTCISAAACCAPHYCTIVS